nr:GNAT family N-acetyltransferase [Geodermatophilaceae bacterium]
PYGEILRGPDEAAFRMLAVAAPWRGHGAGELLVRACIERARALGCARMVISTEAGMQAAGRMYARLGFVRVPGRDWSPQPGVALLCLVLELAQAAQTG